MISAFRVVDRRDPAWGGAIHLTRSSAEAHLAEMARWVNPRMVDPGIEAAEVDRIPDQRVSIEGWHVGYRFNRRSMGRRTLRSTEVRELAWVGDRLTGVACFDSSLPRVPVVWLGDYRWSSYSLADDGSFVTTEG